MGPIKDKHRQWGSGRWNGAYAAVVVMEWFLAIIQAWLHNIPGLIVCVGMALLLMFFRLTLKLTGRWPER